MLQVKNIKKIYKIGKHEVVALDDVSFHLPNGKLVAIVGPSGCGKTTMMNILGALDGEFQGDVVVNGKSLKEARGKDLDTYRKNTIGFIFQQFNLLNSQTSIQNVELALDLSGAPKAAKTAKAKKLLERVGLSAQMKKKVNLLSGGQRQRVAIARALANDPEIILADEPTGALDVKTGEQVMDLLKEISKERLVLMVTHAPELAEAYADYIIKMEDGKIISIEENKSTVTTKISSIEKEETKSKMSIFTALKLSLRNAWLKKGRTIATAIGTSIGICGIALAISITSGTKNAVKTQINGILPSNAVSVTLKENEDKKLTDQKPFEYKDIEPVMAASDNFYGYYFEAQGNDIPMPMFYSLDESLLKDEKLFTKMNEESVRKKLIDTMMPGLIDDVKNDIQYGTIPRSGSTDEITISLSTAKSIVEMDGGEIKDLVGKTIYLRFIKSTDHAKIQTGEKSEIIVKPLKIVGIANTSTIMNTYYVSSDWNINFYEKEFNMDKTKLKSNNFALYAKDTKNLSSELEKINASQDKYVYKLAGETITSQIDSTMKQILWGLLGFAGVSIIVAALMISIVIYISVLERTNEIGILRAIGARKKDIMNIFVAESFIIGMLSALIGIGASIGISKIINMAVYSFLKTLANNAPEMEVAKLPLESAGLILLFCVVLSMISGLYPSLRASRMDPIDALRRR